MGEENPIEALIRDAVRTASNFLVPAGLPDHLWRRLGPEEKLYLKGLEVESHGEHRSGVYQEFARGFGVRDYRFMLRTGKANETRLKTATEFQRRELGESPFGQSLVRHALYAVWRAAESARTSPAASLGCAASLPTTGRAANRWSPCFATSPESKSIIGAMTPPPPASWLERWPTTTSNHADSSDRIRRKTV